MKFGGNFFSWCTTVELSEESSVNVFLEFLNKRGSMHIKCHSIPRKADYFKPGSGYFLHSAS